MPHLCLDEGRKEGRMSRKEETKKGKRGRREGGKKEERSKGKKTEGRKEEWDVHKISFSTPQARSMPRSLSTESRLIPKTTGFSQGELQKTLPSSGIPAVICRKMLMYNSDDDATVRTVPAKVMRLVCWSFLYPSALRIDLPPSLSTLMTGLALFFGGVGLEVRV